MGSVALLPRTRMVTKLLVCLLVLLPGIFAGTKFEKCKRLGTDLCFKMKVKEIVVKIGNVGTNDDVTINLCSDYETDKCCTTPVLSSLLSDDWSKNDTETWKAKKLGDCGTKEFKVQKNLLLTLSKVLIRKILSWNSSNVTLMTLVKTNFPRRPKFVLLIHTIINKLKRPFFK